MAATRCPQSPPVNKEAVLAIQGGGIYALPMLGQARAILAAGYVPMGFAGNSGGAILATLLWSGLTPDRIEAAFTDLLKQDGDALTALLLPRDAGSEPFTLSKLQELPGRLRMILPLPAGIVSGIKWYFNKNKEAGRLQEDALPLWAARGAFSGERFIDFVDKLVKEGLGIRQTSLVRFKDVPKGHARPPLLLTVTNVSHGRLEIIDSADPAYANVPVALAVRASAGFPAFFQPIDLPGMGEGRCFVDGGMIANFPLWAFSASFRENLQKTSDYGWLAPRPWLPIGLRVVDEATEPVDVSAPESYARQLALIAAGMARNDLEDRLVGATLSNQMVVNQASSSLPVNTRTGRPVDILDIEAVTVENIAEIIQSGEKAATDMLKNRNDYKIYDPACAPDVLVCLNDLLLRCEHAMYASADALGFRANIFMPVRSQMHMRFGARMDGYSDDGLIFDSLGKGLTGWCYQTRSPAICNMQILRDIADNIDISQRPYGMDSGLQKAVDPNRSWLISYPMFDPAERQPLRRAPSGLPTIYAPAMHRLKADEIGPILGILNVDAAWQYEKLNLDKMPDLHVADRRIKAVIDAVAQASRRLARLLVGQPLLEASE